MLTVGITGGIGSGKTTVCRVFETLGIPVYYADTEAKRLMAEDPELQQLLKGHFGGQIFENGILNRTRLAGIIFNDQAALQKVNSWVHPAVARDFIHWCSRQTAPYVLEEAAILFESGAYKKFDRTILVTAPEQIRINRVARRDHTGEEAVRERMKNQWPDEKKIPLADFIIHNDDSRLLIPQVLETDVRLRTETDR